MSRIIGRLIRKSHTSRNHRFHVFILKTPKREIQAIYSGFNMPLVNPDKRLILTGHWQQHQEFGTQFHITHYQDAAPVIERTKIFINRIFKSLAS